MGGARSKAQAKPKTTVENPILPETTPPQATNSGPPGIILMTIDAWRYLGRFLNLNHLMKIQGASNAFHKLIWEDVVNSLSFSRVVDLPAVLQSLAKKSPKLQQLNLARHDGVTGKELSHISSLTKLLSLNLKYCSKIQDSHLPYLAPLTNLRTLNLFFCDKLSAFGLVSHLTSLTNLTYLNLKYCSIDNLQLIPTLTRLRLLNLFYCESVLDWTPLRGLTGLEKLDLTKNYHIQESSLDQFEDLTLLKDLKFGSSRMERVVPLTRLTQLHTLRFEDCAYLGDEALCKDISRMTNLRSLSLITISNKLSVVGLQSLTSLENLTYLSLAGNQLPDDAWKALVRLPKIQTMNLYPSSIEGTKARDFFRDMGNSNVTIDF